MDFIQGLDTSKLILVATGLSFLLSPFTSPPYNLPMFLFGIYAQENTESLQALQTFTGLLGGSAIFDIVWMINHKQNGLVTLLAIVLLLLKIPTLLAVGNALRYRGSQFGGLRGEGLSGPTVWAMPGGFTSGGREGYQNVDEERPRPGHHTRPSASITNQAIPTPAPAPYQTL